MPLQPRRGGPSRGGGGSNTRFTGKRGGSSRGRGRGGGGVAYGIDRPAPQREDDGTAAAEKFEEVRVWDEIDTKLGFERFESNRASGEEKVGWLVNMHQVSPFAHPAETSQCGKLRSIRGHVADCLRHSCSPIQILVARQLLISTSSRTMEVPSKQRYLMSRTFS